VRRAGQRRSDDAADLRQLRHQVVLRVQPAGRVDDDDVAFRRLRRVDGVERDGRRVRARLRADEIHADALRPDPELVDGAGAERVTRRQQHARPSRFRRCASLPIVVVLPTPFTPTIR
jgi:hypothetical protein